MFDVETAFRRSIFVLVSLSAIMLALAEEAVFPNALTVPLAVVAYVMTERRQKWQLPVVGANLLGLLALVVTAGEWVGGEWSISDESVMLTRLVAGTHLLIYLAWIVLFQRKTDKHFWWLLALSVLQVAVGSVLTASGVYGLLLFAYLFGAIWTLSLFTLHRARQHLRRPAGLAANGEPPAGRRAAALAGPPSGQILRPSSVVWENNERGWRDQRIDMRFMLGTIGTACTSIVVAICFFFLVPRYWIGRLPNLSGGSSEGGILGMTGFSDVVQLGSMGQILESTERVLFVRMFDSDDRELDVTEYAHSMGYDEPLFRGAALGAYGNGRWDPGRMGNERDFLLEGDRSNNYFRQECRLTLTRSRCLFAIFPIRGCLLQSGDKGVGYQPFSAMLLRRETPRRPSVLEYSVFCLKPPTSLERSRSRFPPRIYVPRPESNFLSREAQDYVDRIHRMEQQCRELPNADGRLSRLKSLARQVAGYDPDADRQPDAEVMAKKLETYLRDSGEYAYSLDSSIVNVDDDPVEDFLFNRKRGHCEYFASALALMLRAVDIPARLVNGFKGGDVNRLTGEFYVEQRHAHAWVEARIGNGWVTLDPTPAAARSESVAGLAPAVLSWDDLTNMIKEQWSSYFISMDVSKQQQRFYEPLKSTVAAAWDALQGDASAAGSRRSLGEMLSSPQNWFNWQSAVFTLGLLLSIQLAVWAVHRFSKAPGAIRTGRHNRRSAMPVRVEFYERFRALCQSLGLARGEAQTEREFLASLDGVLRPELAAAGLERVPAELVDSFYDVRFGLRPLDAHLEVEIDTRLTALERLAAEFKRKE